MSLFYANSKSVDNEELRTYIKRIRVDNTVLAKLPVFKAGFSRHKAVFAASTIGIVAFIVLIIGFFFNAARITVDNNPILNTTCEVVKTIVAILLITTGAVLSTISVAMFLFLNRVWFNNILIPTLKVISPSIKIEEANDAYLHNDRLNEYSVKLFSTSKSEKPTNANPISISANNNKTELDTIEETLNDDNMRKKTVWDMLLPKFSLAVAHNIITLREDFKITEVEVSDHVRSSYLAVGYGVQSRPLFKGILVSRKLPYFYPGELAILSTKQDFLGKESYCYNNDIISSLEPIELEDMAFNNCHDVYSLKTPNSRLSASKFLSPIRLSNVFGDMSYLANSREGGVWCNIYIKDDMLYAAFNTGVTSLFNDQNTPNPENVAKTYMFILREIDEYLNKVIAGR